jgi:O-antigen ligase
VLYLPISYLFDLSAPSSPGISNNMIPVAPAPASKNITDLFVTERVSAISNPFQEHSMIARTAMWRTVITQISYLPLGPLGYGLGTFDAHSLYFTTLFETGIPGIFLLLYLLFRIFRLGYRVYLEEEEEDKKIIIRGLLALLFVFAVMNSTGTHIDAHPGDIYFWFSAGLFMVIRFLRSESERDAGGLIDHIRDAT